MIWCCRINWKYIYLVLKYQIYLYWIWNWLEMLGRLVFLTILKFHRNKFIFPDKLHNILTTVLVIAEGPSWLWSYGSWIYNYLCHQCLSPLMLWVRISMRARCTILCDKVCQWIVTGLWFSPGTPVSSTNKTESQDITEILLKVALNTIKETNNSNSDGILQYHIQQ